MERGERGPDVWSETLEPWGAVRARTVPVLQRECDRLEEQLEKARPPPSRARLFASDRPYVVEEREQGTFVAGKGER
jgi:hypothetical protein